MPARAPAMPAPAESIVTDRMESRYRIEEAVGRGAVGRVYRALDTGLDRPVALKFLRRALADDPAAEARFVREARLAAALDHPHVCTVHAIDRDPQGGWYIAMRWYGGGTLGTGWRPARCRRPPPCATRARRPWAWPAPTAGGSCTGTSSRPTSSSTTTTR